MEDPIVIRPEELSDPKVDQALEQQLTFGMGPARGEAEEPPTSLLFRAWFALMLAGALGALFGWAVIEPFMDDGVRFTGDVGAVDPSARLPLTRGAAEGHVQVSGVDVWLIPGETKVTLDGAPSSLGYLREGQEVDVLGEPVGDGSGPPTAVIATTLHARAGGGGPPRLPPDLRSLGLRQLLVSLMFFPVIAAFVGLFVGAADGVISRAPHRAVLSGLVGLGVGVGMGLVATLFAQVVYTLGAQVVAWVDEGHTGTTFSTPALLVQMVVRGLAWSVAGAAMGLGQGVALRSGRLAINGLLGGVVGALLGGLLFDPIHLAFRGTVAGGELSRAVGIVVIGATTGLMIGIVELIAREAWLKMLVGPLAGKEFVIWRNPTAIGSSPKSEVFLFKDAEVEPCHALIVQHGEGYELEDQGGAAGTWVNGRQVRRARLASGDQVRIGKTVLSFSMKEG